AEWQPQGTRVGWLDGEQLYLDPEAAYAAAQTMAGKKGESITVTPRTLWARLKEKGLLVSTGTRRGTNTTRRTLQGHRQAVLHLRSRNFFTNAERTGAGESTNASNDGDSPPGGEAAAESPYPRIRPDQPDQDDNGHSETFESNGFAETVPGSG